MSAIVKSITPFLNKEILLEALDAINCKYTLQHDNILTERIDYYNNQQFIYVNGRYLFQHDSSAVSENYSWRNLNVGNYKTVNSFLKAVEEKYNEIYNHKVEQERIAKLEEERKAFLEQQKQNIIAKAKKKGYAVEEKKVGNKVKLVLVKMTYG